MPTERQLTANRQNARKSAGPRSPGGKARVGKNAHRHGLSTGARSIPAFEKQIEALALQIAKTDLIDLADARALATAEFDLDRVQRVKTSLINRMLIFGAFDPQFLFSSMAQEVRFIKLVIWDKISVFPQPPDPSASMPKEEPTRTIEAIRRALPELEKLERYEKHAIARLNRVISAVVKSKSADGRQDGPR
jgi:hypothetical protein